MTADMRNEVVLVAGAGTRGGGVGIGQATAILLARAGAHVGILDRNPEWAARTQQAIADEGGTSTAVTADVTDEAGVASAVDAVAGRWGRLTGLVNVVGIPGPTGTSVDVDLAAWDQALRINVTSMVLTSRFVIPHLRRAGGGAIVNISSIGGLLGGDPALLYPVSKGAVVQMTRAQAALHGREGIRVNCVAPGVVYTPFAVQAGGIDDAMREHRRESTLLGTEGTAWDVAAAVRFLLGPDSRWITGVVLPVDGGYTAGRRSPLVAGFHDLPAGSPARADALTRPAEATS